MEHTSLFSIVIAAMLTMVVSVPLYGSTDKGDHNGSSEYILSISFDQSRSTLFGTARLHIPAHGKLTLHLEHLNITGSLLQDELGHESSLSIAGNLLILPPVKQERTLYLSYEKIINQDYNNLIGENAIVLLEDWYPRPLAPKRFTLYAELPDNFEAITESDQFPLARKGSVVTSHFSTPLTSLHFVAGPYKIATRTVRKGLSISTMFFNENKDLAASYLDTGAKFLQRYEEKIGPYPWNHFVVVANLIPTGFGMPTFTLLGNKILGLPFIRDISLGHEILHSWFGNSVEVDLSEGNWCEGLTSYLADHAYRMDEGQGVADRSETLHRYQSYVHDNDMSLADFKYAGHNQVFAEKKRSVGYDRGSMLFHELRMLVGDEIFYSGLSNFYSSMAGKAATWSDLIRAFETASSQDLNDFFTERLHRTDIPSLSIQNIKSFSTHTGYVLRFTLVQEAKSPYTLTVPILIQTMTRDLRITEPLHSSSREVEISLPTAPLSITIDPDYTMLRTLAQKELAPIWSRFLGSRDKMVILGGDIDHKKYSPLLQIIKDSTMHVLSQKDVKNSDLAGHDLLFLGADQPAAVSLFGYPSPTGKQFVLDVRKNPLSPDHVAVLISSPSTQATQGVARRLKHYGKYSKLVFNSGRNVEKTILPVQYGIRYQLELLPQGGRTTQLSGFTDLVKELSRRRVIYIGENHTSTADHSLQLRIIQALHRIDPRIVIGMEMFPAVANNALARYTREGLTVERQFLKESKYYSVWRFDYRLYRDILTFAKNNTLPVVGLNLDRAIVSQVFRDGSTDGLSEKVLSSLPPDRVLDMEGYIERLSEMNSAHAQGGHGSGTFPGFIQAQALWDETMATNITKALTNFPDATMVVIAGNQHTRKDSGIPPRVARRLDVSQASILNLTSDQIPAGITRLADYYFFETAPPLPPVPRIGVVLDESNEGLIISDLSPDGNAYSAGLRKNDVIVGLNSTPVTTMDDLRIIMLDTKAGEKLAVTILKGGDSSQKQKVDVVLSKPPRPADHP